MTVRIGLIGAGRIGAMHAANLAALRTPEGAPAVRLSITDAVPEQAAAVAARTGAAPRPTVRALLDDGVDGLVVATGTASHPELIRAGLQAGLPVFCEKPVALSVEEAMPLLDEIERVQGVVQIGHQRRFDPGYVRARELHASGALGWLHTVRAVTGDMTPPPVEFLATSGGLFRDCSVHDVDVLRWITGREVTEVYARGSNRGDPRIGEVGDVDTALAVLTLDDGTVATVAATRYNGAGHDVRLELQGSQGSVAVGMDEHMAMRSAEPGVGFPAGPPHTTFHDRFAEAYRREMAAFVQVVRGEIPSPCTARDAVAASRVADAAQRSLETGAAVRVEPLEAAPGAGRPAGRR
ncbi:dehydrogenase [Kocuria rosea subsp. polaris]|uniref:Dehydrogenase n=1 Tax=Kocuria rosea subsp. polaris TaxID=136273 RepID=A0A0W8I9V6_KOCRO|nr:Gfo/Idh/MocA family oxidoreductase [Kocuria polaris]KUG56573.1 dehydrogenase [Kocuria polaris]